MSTTGLRRVNTFEEVLAAATKDGQRQPEEIGIGLQNAATRVINSPDFQRVQDRLTEDLETQQRQSIEQRTFTNNIQSLAVEARVNRSDLDYIVRNLQQPPQAPPPPPPATNFAADRERLAAELDGIAMQRQRAEEAAAMAQQTYANLMAQRLQSPAERIIERHVTPSPPQPIFTQPVDLSQTVRQMGLSFHQYFLRQGREVPPPPPPPSDEIPIQMLGGGGPPPPPPGGQRVRAFGPVRKERPRPAPYSSDAIVPVPGGSSSAQRAVQLQLPEPPSWYTADQKLDWYLAHQQGRQPPQVARPPKRRRAKVGVPSAAPDPPAAAKKRPATAEPAPRAAPRQPPMPEPAPRPRMPPPIMPYAGQGRQLDLPRFTGHAERIGEAHANTLRAAALQRMREVGHQRGQTRRRAEMLERIRDGARAVRRIEGQGEVVPLGKRKRAQGGIPEFRPRQRVGARPAGPQQFSLTY